MKMPNVVITFSEKAAIAIQNGERGIVAMILKEATLPSNVFQTYYSVNDISEDDNISEANVEQIKLALKGYQTSPRKVIVYFIKSGEGSVDYKPALDRLANEKFQYLVIPTVATDSKTEDIVSWIKSEREKNDHMVKAVLPNTKADSEAIINYTI